MKNDEYARLGMMSIFTVSFFGHRYVDNINKVEDQLETLLRKLLSEHEYCEFLVGRDGDFDQCVSSAIVRTKRTYRDDNCSHVLVLPYMRNDFLDNEQSFGKYYDEVEVCEQSAGAHFKAAFQMRNRSMVDRSDLVVFDVEHESGGAYQTMKYAKAQEKEIINLADLRER